MWNYVLACFKWRNVLDKIIYLGQDPSREKISVRKIISLHKNLDCWRDVSLTWILAPLQLMLICKRNIKTVNFILLIPMELEPGTIRRTGNFSNILINYSNSLF